MSTDGRADIRAVPHVCTASPFLLLASHMAPRRLMKLTERSPGRSQMAPERGERVAPTRPQDLAPPLRQPALQPIPPSSSRTCGRSSCRSEEAGIVQPASPSCQSTRVGTYSQHNRPPARERQTRALIWVDTHVRTRAARPRAARSSNGRRECPAESCLFIKWATAWVLRSGGYDERALILL